MAFTAMHSSIFAIFYLQFYNTEFMTPVHPYECYVLPRLAL